MKTWRVGTLTAGILCVGLGIIWIISNLYSNINFFTIISFLFPLTLILLGIEILLQFWLKDTSPLKIDIFSVVIMIALSIGSLIATLFAPTGILSQQLQLAFEDVVPVTFSKDITDLEGIEEIVIEASYGNVNVSGSNEANSINIYGHVEANISKKDDISTIINENLIVNRFGNQLRISDFYKNYPSSFKSKFSDISSREMNIICPSNIPLRIESKSINTLAVDNINNGLTINDNNSSEINLNNISSYLSINNNSAQIQGQKIQGNLDITSTYGHIYLKKIDLIEQGKIGLGDSNLDIDNLTGSIQITGNNSDININDSIFTGTSNILLQSGTINLNLPETNDLLINSQIENGNFSTDDHFNDSSEESVNETITLSEGVNTLVLSIKNGDINFTKIKK